MNHLKFFYDLNPEISSKIWCLGLFIKQSCTVIQDNIRLNIICHQRDAKKKLSWIFDYAIHNYS